MNQDDILLSTKSVIQGLNTLKNEHGKILESIVDSSKILSSNQNEEKLVLLRKSMDMIDLGISEAQIMIHLSNHLQNLEFEKQKLRTQVKRLSQENAWLRDELGSTQNKFHECKQINGSYSVEIEHLKFLKDVKPLNIDNENSTNQIILEIIGTDSNNQEQDNSKMNLFISSSQSANDLFISTIDYEIPTRLKTLHHLVIQYASQGRYEIAVPLCRQALEDLEKTFGHQHPDVATMLNILALVHRDQSKFKEAIVLLNDALSIREKTLGFDHPAVAATLNNLAVLYSKLSKFKEAEPLCKRALEIREKYLGPSDPDVAKQLNNLALLCQNQGKYNEAEIYYKRAIDIYMKSVDLDDPNIAKTKNNLASAYLKQQKYKEAEQLYKDVLTHAYEKDSLSSIHNSTTTIGNYDAQGNWYKPIRVDTPIVTTTLKNLSFLYRQQGRYDAADILENCASRAPNDSQAIIRALHIIKLTNNSS